MNSNVQGFYYRLFVKHKFTIKVILYNSKYSCYITPLLLVL